MLYIADGALLKIQHVKLTKGDPVVIHTQEYDAKMKAIDTVVKVLPRKSVNYAPAEVETNRSRTGKEPRDAPPRQLISPRG